MGEHLLGPSESVLAVDEKALSTTMSPISILSDDILSLIFGIDSRTITSSFSFGVNLKGSALNTARAASQVCQHWRSLLLHSPTIWGRCVNLNVLKDGKSEWWEEVLKRTQSSPLWIVGHVPESTSAGKESPMDMRCYFRRLLQSWERIQKLDVLIYGEEISEDIQHAFLSPAPILNLFEVYLGRQDPLFMHTLLPDSTQALFSDYAPSLVEIRADTVAFRTDSPWLANLRNIHIPLYVDVPGILDLLSRVPLLETLFVSSSETESWNLVGDMPSGTRISLPHLSAMYLYNTLVSCTTIIDHVSPAKDCSIAIGSSDYSPISSQVGVVLKERLSTYISNYFTTHPATHISFQLDSRKFKFKDVNTSDGRNFFEKRLQLSDSDSALLPFVSVMQAFVVANQLSPSLFNTVTKLDIATTDIATSIVPELYAMLLLFQSVEHLTTDDVGIRYILQLSLQGHHYERQPVLFPKIHTLQMTHLSKNRDDGNNDQSLLQFLGQRKNAGLPISKLDLTRCVLHALPDISDLDRVHGLEVVWRSDDTILSYVCGSGDTEMLVQLQIFSLELAMNHNFGALSRFPSDDLMPTIHLWQQFI